MRVALLVVVSLHLNAASVLVPAATYYVDSVYGSDSNNGTSATTAFQTIGKVMQQAFTSGTSIALGSPVPGAVTSWRESISTNQGGLSFIGYGTTQPLLDCSSAVSSVAWTKTAGFTNIYQASITVENLLGWIRLWENNVSFLRAASLADLDANASEYFPSGDPNGGGGVTFTLYVHASDGSNPATNGKAYDFNQHGCMTLLGDHSTVINLRLIRNLSNNGSIDCHGKYCSLIDTLSEDGTKHNVYIGTGGTAFRAVAHNAYYANQGSDLFVYNANTPNGEGIMFNSTNAYVDIPSSGVGGIGGYIGHVNISGSFGAVAYINVSATNTASGINTAGASVGYLVNANITGVASAVEVDGPLTISGGTLSCDQSCVQIFAPGPLMVSDVSMSANGSVIQDFTGISTIIVTGSTLDIPIGNGYLINQSTSGTGLTISVHDNNMIGNHTFGYALSAPYSLDSDFNAWTFSAGNMVFQLGSSVYNSYAAYKAGTGQDQHSTP